MTHMLFHVACLPFVALLPTPLHALSRTYSFSDMVDVFPDINPHNENISIRRDFENQFSVSTKSPIATSYGLDPQLRDSLTPLFFLFRNLSSILASTSDANLCNLREIPWIENRRRQVMRRQFGLLNNSCNARIDISKVPLESTNLTEHETNHLSFHAVETVLKRAKTSMKLAYDYAFERGEFPKELDLTWWNGTFEIRRALLPVIDSQICSMNNLAALKYQGDWYISTGVSNYEADFFVTNFSRQFMHEYVNENFSRSLQGVQPKLEDTKRFVQATTVVTGKYFGREGAEYILRQGGFSPFDYYSPLGGVFRQNSAAIELANDAITVSNVAILALPMVMALIPAAFFTDIQVFALCMFTIATDVIGVLPFFIKGVEMIYATRSRSDVVSYHLGNETLGLVRVFAVKCEGVPKFRWLGVTFVIVAICTMMLGVGLEIFAWRAMKRRRKEGKQGPFYVGGDDDIPRDLDTYSKLM